MTATAPDRSTPRRIPPNAGQLSVVEDPLRDAIAKGQKFLDAWSRSTAVDTDIHAEAWRRWVWGLQPLMHVDPRSAQPIVLLANVALNHSESGLEQQHVAALKAFVDAWRHIPYPDFGVFMVWDDALKAAGLDVEPW